MPRLFCPQAARHLSYLVLITLASGCSQLETKDPSSAGGSKFSVFTRGGADNRAETKDSNKSYNSIWDRMLSMYALPEIDNARIDREVNWYLRNPEYLSRVQQRAEPYLYFILNELEAKQMPGELALLPAIESAFRPEAQSPAQASGLWQFIPPTGRLYGLKQNSWFDGRRDVVESTQAATSFLKDLSHNFNNDWLLALASYNAGKGNIKNAIDRNNYRGLPTDFWSLDLNHETSSYVPRLLAIAKIFANPEKYNLNLHRFPNQPYFELVDIQSQLDLGKAAELAQTPIDDLLKLNPGFNRWSTDPAGPHRLLIPVNKAPAFKEKLAELPHQERIKWQHHTVAGKESLKTIAKKHNTSVDLIQEVNHLYTESAPLGKTLLIPTSYQALKAEFEPKTATASTAPTSSSQTLDYTVKKGDTLRSVAKRFAVDSDDLLIWNKGIKAKLTPGDKLKVKKAGNITVASNAPTIKQINYTTKKGDSLAGVAKKFNVSVSELRKWNPSLKKTEPKQGTSLKLLTENAHTAS
jgi:membrane-bound lytic murein transglycosylase D